MSFKAEMSEPSQNSTYIPNFVLVRSLIAEMNCDQHAYGGSSDLLVHASYPELYVKTTSDEVLQDAGRDALPKVDQVYLEELREIYSVYKELEERDLEIVPFSLQAHNEKAYIFTRKVHGGRADHIAEQDAEVRKQLDHANSEILRFMQQKYRNGGYYPLDLNGMRQFMYGNYGGNEPKRIIYVDIDPVHDRIVDAQKMHENGSWAAQIVDACEDILETEADVKALLPESRTVIVELLEEVKKDNPDAAELFERFTSYLNDPNFDYHGHEYSAFNHARIAILKHFNHQYYW